MNNELNLRKIHQIRDNVVMAIGFTCALTIPDNVKRLLLDMLTCIQDDLGDL